MPVPALVISSNVLRRTDFLSRVRAAREAGFDGIGLRVSDYVSATQREGLRATDLGRILDDFGVQVFEVEAAWDWTDARGAEHRRHIELLEQMHEHLHFHQFNAFIFHDVSLDRVRDGYGGLCDDLSMTVALENIPYGPVRTLDAAVEIVESCSRPNGGLILDSWHYFRSASNLSSLTRLAPSAVRSVQISNVAADPDSDLAEEARHRRAMPAEGAADLTAWMQAVLEGGARCPISIEVVNDLNDSRDAPEVAAAMFKALAQLLGAAYATAPPAEGWNTP